jgi:hypothetical protein
LIGSPEHYKDSLRVIETNQEYQTLKESINSLTGEWDELTSKIEKMNQEFQEAMDNIGV